MSDEKEKDTPDLSPIEQERAHRKAVDQAATGFSEGDGPRRGVDPFTHAPPSVAADYAGLEQDKMDRELREGVKGQLEEIEERARAREEREEAKGAPKSVIQAMYLREVGAPPGAIVETDEEGNPVGWHLPGEALSTSKVL